MNSNAPKEWRPLKAKELPIIGDEWRGSGDREWQRNFINHDTPAGDSLWGGLRWRRRTTPVADVLIPLTRFPEFLKDAPQ